MKAGAALLTVACGAVAVPSDTLRQSGSDGQKGHGLDLLANLCLSCVRERPWPGSAGKLVLELRACLPLRAPWTTKLAPAGANSAAGN